MVARLKARLIHLLRRSEKFTKTDMVYLASGGFWNLFSQVVAILSSIPLSLAFANLLTPNDYGIYRYILTVSVIVGALSLTGLPTALTRAAARGFDGSLQTAFRLNLRWSIFMMLASLAGAAYYAVRGNFVLAGAMVLIGAFSPLLNSGNLFSSFLSGKKMFRVNAIYANRRTVIHTVAILATLLAYPEPLAILVTYFAIQAATALYYYRKVAASFIENEVMDPEMARLGKHMSLLNVFSTLTDKLDAVLLFQHVGAAQLAIYSFAEMAPDVMNRLNKIVASLAFPKFSARKTKDGIMGKTALLFLALLPLVVLYILLAPYIFALLFPAYMASVPFTQALAVLVLINGSLPSTYIDAQGAVRLRYIVNITSNIVKLFAIGIGVIFFGIWGAVIGRYITKIFSASITFLAWRQLHR